MELQNPKALLILFLILFSVSVISYFQGYKISCDRIFMCFIYCSLLIVLYFTYSVIVAKKMLHKQIKAMVTDIKGFQNFFNITRNRINDSADKTDDSATIERNKSILRKSIKIVVITLCLSFILSGGLWIYKNQNHKNYNIKKYLKEIFVKNIIILFCVLLIQLFFSSVFVAHVLPLNSRNIINIILDKVLEDK